MTTKLLMSCPKKYGPVWLLSRPSSHLPIRFMNIALFLLQEIMSQAKRIKVEAEVINTCGFFTLTFQHFKMRWRSLFYLNHCVNACTISCQEAATAQKKLDANDIENMSDTNQDIKNRLAETVRDNAKHLLDPDRKVKGEPVPAQQPHLFTGGVMRWYQIEGIEWLRVSWFRKWRLFILPKKAIFFIHERLFKS